MDDEQLSVVLNEGVAETADGPRETRNCEIYAWMDSRVDDQKVRGDLEEAIAYLEDGEGDVELGLVDPKVFLNAVDFCDAERGMSVWFVTIVYE